MNERKPKTRWLPETQYFVADASRKRYIGTIIRLVDDCFVRALYTGSAIFEVNMLIIKEPA